MGLLILVYIYGSELSIWQERERSMIRAVEMDNLSGLLAIRKILIIRSAWVRVV